MFLSNDKDAKLQADAAKAIDGKLLIDLGDYVKATDPNFQLVGDSDIEDISSVLGQHKHNNLIYVGRSGVGKTATLKGIAQRKNQVRDGLALAKDAGVPLHMIDRRLRLLDVNALFDHDDTTKISEDISKIFSELSQPGHNVLVIEDANDLTTHLDNNQINGFTSRLMNHLRKGDFQAILMVRDEAAKNKLDQVLSIHSDMRELFTVLNKTAPDKQETLDILKNHSLNLQSHFNGLSITNEAVEEIVNLTEQYPNLSMWLREAPAKQINLLDRISGIYVSRMQVRPPHLRELDKKLEHLKSGDNAAEIEKVETEIQAEEARWSDHVQAVFSKTSEISRGETMLQKEQVKLEKLNAALKEEVIDDLSKDGNKPTEEDIERHIDFQKTPEIKTVESTIRQYKKAIEKTVLEADALKAETNLQITLDKADVVSIFSELSKIPAKDLNEDETEKLLKLEDHFKEVVFGQDRAVHTVAAGIRVAKAGLRDPERPIGVYVLLGPSGVGKTYMAEVTADIMFGGRENMTSFDMSEFSEKHTIANLIGAPAGYAGYGNGGKLLNTVRKKPYQVILFDEMEKATKDIFKIGLQLFDKGRLSDENGTVKYNNTVIFLTTNLGQTLSFDEDLDPTSQDGQARIKDALRGHFPQELLNRVDGFLLFNALKPEHIQKIIKRDISKYNKTSGLSGKGLSIEISDDDIAKLVEDEYRPEEGARQVKNFVSTNLSCITPITLRHKEKDGPGTIRVIYNSSANGKPNHFTAELQKDQPASKNTTDMNTQNLLKPEQFPANSNRAFAEPPAFKLN